MKKNYLQPTAKEIELSDELMFDIASFGDPDQEAGAKNTEFKDDEFEQEKFGNEE